MTRARRMAKSLLWGVVVVLAGLACGDGGIGPGTPVALVVTPAEITLQAGETVQMSATLEDVNGDPLSTSGVSWTSSDSRVAQVSETGLVTGAEAGGPITVTAIAGTMSGRALVTVTSGPPAQMTIETQPSASGISGLAFGRQPVVQLRDAGGNLALEAGVLVTAVLAEGSGTLANATATTDGVGRAAFSGLTVTGASGTYRLRFESTGVSGVDSDDITLSAVASLEFSAEPPPTAQSGSTFGTQPQITVLDAGGAPVNGESVTASIVSGSATLLGTATLPTNGSGVAAFTDLGLTGSVGDYTLSFTAGSISLESGVISLQAGPPTSVVVLTQPPASAPSGATFIEQPVIEVRDEVGNLVSGVDVDVSLATGGGTLGGATTAVTDGLGRATFSDLSITGAPGEHTLQFQAGTATAVSQAIDLTSGLPTLLTIQTQPSSSAQSGVPFLQQPVVEVRDEGGHPTAGVDVVAALATGNGGLAGTLTAVTNGSGIATFADLSISGLVGDHTLTFGSGAASIQSGTIVLGVGPPASVIVLVHPSPNAQSGVAFAQQPSVEVHDDGGNPVDGANVDASIASGGGILGGVTTITTDGAGQATFGDLSIMGTVGPHVLQFFAGAASAFSQTVDLMAGPPALLTVVTQPSSSAQSGVQLGQQPVVDVRDAAGNPAAGSVVTASIASGGGTLGGTQTAAVGADGTAAFNSLSISGPVGQQTLRFMAGIAGATSQPIMLAAGPVAELVITLQPSSTAANALPFPQQPSVRAEDDADNPVSGVDITAVIQTGGGTLGGTTTLTSSGAGIAAFTNLAITGSVGARTLRFSTNGLNVTSDAIAIEAGDPTSVVIVTQPPDFAISGVTLSRSPVVEVRDVSGNTVQGENVVATIASGGGSLGGTTTVATGGGGSATFDNLSIMGSLGARTVRFTSSGIQTTSSSVHVSYGQGTYSDVTYCPSEPEQIMDVYVPANSVTRPLPVAVYIHGGGWTSGDKTSGFLMPEVRDELLSRGYLVVSLNYRLATTTTNKWPAQIHDVKCAIRHMRAEADDYGFDGERIGVWGASAGGHLGAMLGVTHPSGFEGSEGYPGWSSSVKAAVPVSGISDLTQGPTHPELNFGGPEKAFTSWPGPSAELDNASPISWTTSNDAPFLIVHGDQDPTVLPAQATRLRDSLNAANATVTLLMVTNGGHQLEDVGMGTPSLTIAQVTDAIADFLDTHVRFNP